MEDTLFFWLPPGGWSSAILARAFKKALSLEPFD